jgi:hypothetical protein
MSRQFRFYLLPSDIERVVAELRARFGVKVIEADSPKISPVEIDSPVRAASLGDATSIYCYLMPPAGADIKTWYMVKRQLWAVDISSEVIQFSGCDYDGNVLLIGRFYFQTDFLDGDSIWRKRPEFLAWAGKIFRWTKKFLHWSKELQAYVGEDAMRWKQNGGRFDS